MGNRERTFENVSPAPSANYISVNEVFVYPAPEPRPTCEARTGPLKDFADNMPLWCTQTRGLRKIIDGNGHAHYACGAKGHEANVRRWVGRNVPVAMAPGELSEAWGR